VIRKILFIFVAALLACPAVSLNAGTLKGVEMPDSIEVAGQKLVLNGMALRKKIIFKVYVAGLYLPTKEKNAEKILAADTTRHLIMHFLRSVKKGQLNDAWMDGLEDNVPDASAEVKKKFDTLCSYMDNVKNSDRIVFTYIPDKGTEVKVKGAVKGNIGGKDFADALFASWIGPKPGPGEGFKEDILGID